MSVKYRFSQRVWSALRGFAKNEQGAITVDWVVITAGVCALAIGAYGMFSFDVEDVSQDELSFVVMTGMGMTAEEDEKRGPIGRLIHGIKYKTTLLRACLGMGISSSSGPIATGTDDTSSYCSFL